MDEYSSLGPSLVILPPADRVLKVSPKRGPGDQKGKKKKQRKKTEDGVLKGTSVKDHSRPSEIEEASEGKGKEIDIII